MISLYPVIAEKLHSQCCYWVSISNQPMQMRIFLALLRGGVEVLKDE